MECAACTVTMIHKIGELDDDYNDNDKDNSDCNNNGRDNGNIFWQKQRQNQW